MVFMKKNGSTACVADIVDAMEYLAPPCLAEEWDNCGLQVGSRQWAVRRIWIALDPLTSVVQAAATEKIDMVITHHPLLFQPLRTIDADTPVGRIIETALSTRMALYAAHTNLDSAFQGVNDVLAQAIGLRDLRPMIPAECATHIKNDQPEGLGRVGRLGTPVSLANLAEQIKTRLKLPVAKVAGDLDRIVEYVAVCSGSGGSLLEAFLDTSAQVYVSGDLRYHDARSVEDANRGLIDIGHFCSEHIVLDPLAERLRALAREKGWRVSIETCPLERDPFASL
jgi:dinuclear metal center YbgI/SA1388 family protein